MVTPLNEQAASVIKPAQNILILFRNEISGDSLSSALALGLALRHKGKRVQIVAPDFRPGKFLFLPDTSLIQTSLTHSGEKLVISIAGGKEKLDEFWYEEKESRINVLISAK